MPKSPSSRLGRLALGGRHRAEAAVIASLSMAARHSSLRVRNAAADAIGTLQWAMDRRHRLVACDNLRQAYGEAMSPQDVRRLARRAMQHFARVTIETLAFDRYLAGEIDARVRVEGLEHGLAALSKGRGAIGFTGHIGHWELLAVMFGRLGVPVASIARPLDNPYLERRLARLRALSGNTIIDKHSAFRPALTHLRRGGGLGFLIDQRPKEGGIPVPFFGRPAYTTEGLALLALTSKAPVVPCFVVAEPNDAWRMVLEPEVPVATTGNREADIYRLTADCTAILERWIRRYPDQWLWTHRRWALPTGGVKASRPADHDDAP